MTKMHKYLCDKIQEFLQYRSGKALDILLLSVPPRHGKSFCVTETLPTWWLGNKDRGEVIIASYQSTFAEEFGRKNREKFNSLAPFIWNAGPDKSLQRSELWATNTGGRCRSAGLDAGITGYGADLFIIDDPVKSRKEADSQTIMQRILSEMGPSVQSRIYPGGKLIVIQTRWVENDVVGFIKDNWADFIWADINLPCECESDNDPLGRKPGESLMGWHMGDNEDLLQANKINNNMLWLRDKKMIVVAADGQREWDALYQGRPTGQSGNYFESQWWKSAIRREFCTEEDKKRLLPHEFVLRKRFEYLQMSVDATFTDKEGNDFVAIGIHGIYKGGVYLWHFVNMRLDFVKTVNKIKELYELYPELDEMVIENKANGPAIISTLQYIDGMPPIVPVDPQGGKVSRAKAITNFVKAGNYYLFDTYDEDEVEWYKPTDLKASEKFIQQFGTFPFGKHDDIVDMTSQGVVRLIKLITGEEPKAEKRYLRYTKWYPDMWADFEKMDPLAQEKFIQTYGAPLEYDPDYHASSY